MRVTLEVDREEDGRWIAEIPELPGVMVYGDSEDEAVARVIGLARRVLNERAEVEGVREADLVVPLRGLQAN